MQLEKVIYINAKKHHFFFKNLYLIHFNITFSKNNQYSILYLKPNKKNINFVKILIILATILIFFYLV